MFFRQNGQWILKLRESFEQPADVNKIIHMENICKRFYIGTENELEVLHNVGLDVMRGEFTSIVGESGSGKSTLMNIIGLLDHPTEGTYRMMDVDISRLSDTDLSRIRNRQIGFVFQTYNLIARTSALKNVEMPMMYAKVDQKTRTERAKELLEMVGMGDRMNHKPDELSGGQKQRVAIARALANDPAIILADEPTGALDSRTGRMVMDLFHKLHEEQGRTILLITHSQALAEETGRILTLVDGQFTDERAGSLVGERVRAAAEEAESSAEVSTKTAEEEQENPTEERESHTGESTHLIYEEIGDPAEEGES